METIETKTPKFEKTFEDWRKVAREYLLAGVPPQAIHWNVATPSLFSMNGPENLNRIVQKASSKLTVPREYLEIAESVAYARDEDRWDLLYRILYRLQHENPELLKVVVDPDVLRAQLLKKSVRRDIHKMHAFVRFKLTHVEVDGEKVEHYMAWHKSEHLTIRPGTPFFVRRFGDKPWSIWTPDESAHWDLEKLTFGAGMERHSFEIQDEWDDVWKTYYKSIFNPARIKIKMMKSEMAPKYWSSMPETALIPELIRASSHRLQQMGESAQRNGRAVVDPKLSLPELQRAASQCTACLLFQNATQTVFGEGPERASIMIVGEQPGDQEDQAGRPFVGPAGEVFEKALSQTGLKREDVYLTNAVKHFKWKPQGKTRLHMKPSGREMHACKPWLEAEIAKVKPKVIVALGVTAATAILGRLPNLSGERGRVITDLSIAPAVIVSWHPAAILRAINEEEAKERLQQMQDDLKLAYLTEDALKR